VTDVDRIQEYQNRMSIRKALIIQLKERAVWVGRKRCQDIS